jgi:hypothetical protein
VQEHYLHSLARLSNLKKQEFAIYEEAYNKKDMKPLEYINKSYEYEAYLNNLDKLK